MIGKVLEGRYVGASICKLPDKNVLFIETEDGERIALSKKNVISIDDVTDQYSSYGGKAMMVMWNDFETSIILIGISRNKSQPLTAEENLSSASIVPKKKIRKRKIWITSFLVLGLLIIACGYFAVPPIFNNHEYTRQFAACEHTWISATCEQPKTCEVCGKIEGDLLPHSWIEATCQKPKTCSICGVIEGGKTGHKKSNGEWIVVPEDPQLIGLPCEYCNTFLAFDKNPNYAYPIEYVISNWEDLKSEQFYVEGWVLSHNTVQFANSGGWRSWCTIYSSTDIFPSLADSTNLSTDWLINGYDTVGLEIADFSNDPVKEIANMQTGDYVRAKVRVNAQESAIGYFVSLDLMTIEILEEDEIPNHDTPSDIPSVLYDESGRLRKADEFIEIYDTILSTAYKRYYGKTLSIRKEPGSQLSNSYGIYIDGEPSGAMINFMYKGDDTPADNSFDQIILMAYTDSGDDTGSNIFCITTLMSSAKPTVSDVMDSTSIFEEMLYELSEPGVDFSEYTVQGVKYKMSILPVENRPTMIFSIDISALR